MSPILSSCKKASRKEAHLDFHLALSFMTSIYHFMNTVTLHTLCWENTQLVEPHETQTSDLGITGIKWQWTEAQMENFSGPKNRMEPVKAFCCSSYSF